MLKYIRNIIGKDAMARRAMLVAAMFVAVGTTAMAQVAPGVERNQVTLEGAGLSTDKVYSLTSGTSAHTLCANGSAIDATSQNSSATDANYRFAFVKDPNTGKVYLYNVGTRRFLHRDKSLGYGSGDNIYLWPGRNAGTYVISFSDNIDNWNNRTSNTNLGYYIVQGGSDNVSINDWSRIGDGLSQSFTIAEVEGATYDHDVAQRHLTALSDTYAAYSADKLADAGIEVNTAAYTFNTYDHSSLYATSGGVTRADRVSGTKDDNNSLFVFVTDPNNPSNVYLYSVGAKRFVTGAASNDGSARLGTGPAGTSVLPVYAYNSDDYDYPLSFTFTTKSGWTTAANHSDGERNLNVVDNGVNVNATSTFSYGNRFRLDKGGAFSAADLKTAQRVLAMRNTYTAYSTAELAAAGIKTNNTVYTINTNGRSSLYATSSGVIRSSLVSDTSDRNGSLFVFVTNPSDTTQVFLYSVGQRKFLNGNENGNYAALAAGSNGRIYIYNTNDFFYPYAFSFSPSTTWETGRNTSRGSRNFNVNESGIDISNYSLFDAGNRFRLDSLAKFSSADLEIARRILTLPSNAAMLASPFHYRGASRKDFLANGMQDVSQVDYYYYVDTRRQQYGTKADAGMHAIDLMLPFKRYLNRSFVDNTVLYKSTTANYTGSSDVNNASNGNNYEPKGYIRWYDYKTDALMDGTRLIPWQAAANNLETNQVDATANRLNANIYDMNGKALGLLLHGLNGDPNAAKIGAAYVIPSDADNADWAGDDVACDVSFYTDFNVPLASDGNINGEYSSYSQNLSDFRHEPTLTTRYVYHILPSKRIANELRSALLNKVNGQTFTYGNRGVFSFGAKDDAATMTLRIPLQDVPHFYFWPLDDYTQHHVYHKYNDGYGIEEGDIDNSGQYPEEAAWIEYRVYSSDSTMWRTIRTDRQKMATISVNMLNGSGSDWHYLDNTLVTADKAPHIRRGGTCFLVGYALNEDKTKACPFFNARLDITNNSPLAYDNMSNGQHPQRMGEYLQRRFGSPVAQFSFDNENTMQNLNPPTMGIAYKEVSDIPYDFARREYSFLYLRDLIGYDDDGSPRRRNKAGGQSPRFRNLAYNDGGILLHGDYVLAKQMGIGGGDFGFDMLHQRDPSQYGYFMFTDASDESRALGSQDFEGSLCSGSQIIVSAWVRNGNGSRYVSNDRANNINAAPELRFTLLGVEKDAKNNDVSTKEFAALCTGDFYTNIDNFSNGVTEDTKNWYQVFGAITLPANSGVENYTDFRIVIDNFCSTADGADYAIDDIYVYQSNSKVEVIQDPALCADDDAIDNVRIKIRANYNTARQLTDAENGEKQVYYRFVMPSTGTAGTPVAKPNFYGDGRSSYGVAVIPQNEDLTAQLPDGQGPQFEENVEGISHVILVNRPFALNPDSTYYVSLALDDGTGNPGSWGLPSRLCSFYSDNFSLVHQNISIKETLTKNLLVTVPCGTKDAGSSAYSGIRASISAPSHIGTGSVQLIGVPFHWFGGSAREYAAAKYYKYGEEKDRDGNPVKTDSVYLADAVKAYVDAYPGQPYKADNPTVSTEGGYSADYKAAIESFLYNADTNTDGRLIMNAVDSLGVLPLKIGRDTVTAVVATGTFQVSGVSYTLCPDPMELFIQVAQNGPGLSFGFSNVIYPSSETVRTIRLGLPQLRKMRSADGTISIPIREISYEGNAHTDEALKFLGLKDDDTPCDSIYITNTTDPSINLRSVEQTYFGKLTANTLAGGATNLAIRIANFNMIHEGYEYVLMFKYKSTNYGTTAGEMQCAGESYLRLRIVPEYVIWEPTADNGMNSNWNNDANWRRATARELYRTDYTDYGAATLPFNLYDAQGRVVKQSHNPVDTSIPESMQKSAAYTPMYFTKVIIPTMNSGSYPMLGYIAHQENNNLVKTLLNTKRSEATLNIRYDMRALPSNSDSTSYSCNVFDGNICDEIHFMTGGQLREEQFLNYRRAWCELALPLDMWGTFTTPMDHSIAADMYVPKVSAMQLTPLFREIRFTDVDAVDAEGRPYRDGTSSGDVYGLYGKAGDTMYNRVRMPVYQKLWGENASMHGQGGGNYSAYDNPYQMLIFPDNKRTEMKGGVNASNYNVWSHSFNFLADQSKFANPYAHSVNGIYDGAYGVAGKIADEFTKPSAEANPTGMAVMRLPKADTSFRYYNPDAQSTPGVETIDVTELRKDNYRLGVKYNPVDGDLGVVTLTTAALQPFATLAYEKGKKTEDGGLVYVKDQNGNILFSSDPYGITVGEDGSIAPGDTTSVPNGLVYDLVGNPYTSAISVRDFIRGNTDIMRKVYRDGEWVYRIWTLYGDKLLEYDDVDINTTIAPGQSFFIMIQRPGQDVVTFTTRMQTDPNLTQGSLAPVVEEPAPAKVYTVNDFDDVTKIIENPVDNTMRCWSPLAGQIMVSGDGITGVDIYSVNGQLVTRSSALGSENRFAVPSGVYIVRAAFRNSTTQTKKVAVR